MKPIEVAVIGTGWCGGIRAETLANHALVKGLHLAEVNGPRLAELAGKTKAKTAIADYKELLKKTEIEAVYISATPGDYALPDRPRLPRRGQACLPREADRARARGSG